MYKCPSERKCPVCGNQDWGVFHRSKSGRFLNTDQRVLPGNIAKIYCKGCFCVRNEYFHTELEYTQYYKDEYILNIDLEEHTFFLKEGKKGRSAVISDWVLPYLPENGTFYEIGAGSGNVLEIVQRKKSSLRCSGIEGNLKAVKNAQDKGLNVKQGFIRKDSHIEKADIYFAFGVLEHVIDPLEFIDNLTKYLNPGGRIILALPVQNSNNYDVFFQDHNWHFANDHIVRIFNDKYLETIIAPSNPNYPGFSLFIAKKTRSRSKIVPERNYYQTQATYNRDYWIGVFNKVDAWLAETKACKIAVFGASEVFSLFWAYTELANSQIVFCIDEDENKVGSIKHSIPIKSLESITKDDIDKVLLCINERYHEVVINKLSHLVNNIFSWKY